MKNFTSSLVRWIVLWSPRDCWNGWRMWSLSFASPTLVHWLWLITARSTSQPMRWYGNSSWRNFTSSKDINKWGICVRSSNGVNESRCCEILNKQRKCKNSSPTNMSKSSEIVNCKKSQKNTTEPVGVQTTTINNQTAPWVLWKQGQMANRRRKRNEKKKKMKRKEILAFAGLGIVENERTRARKHEKNIFINNEKGAIRWNYKRLPLCWRFFLRFFSSRFFELTKKFFFCKLHDESAWRLSKKSAKFTSLVISNKHFQADISGYVGRKAQQATKKLKKNEKIEEEEKVEKFSLLRSIKIACRRQIPKRVKRRFEEKLSCLLSKQRFFFLFNFFTSSRERVSVVRCCSKHKQCEKKKLKLWAFFCGRLQQVESRIWSVKIAGRRWWETSSYPKNGERTHEIVSVWRHCNTVECHRILKIKKFSFTKVSK